MRALSVLAVVPRGHSPENDIQYYGEHLNEFLFATLFCWLRTEIITHCLLYLTGYRIKS